MEVSKPKFEKYIFVCENKRAAGECCAAKGSKHLRVLLKQAIHDRGLKGRVRVSRSGCLDVCSQGANVLLMPDNIWFKHVKEKDIERIVETAVVKNPHSSL